MHWLLSGEEKTHGLQWISLICQYYKEKLPGLHPQIGEFPFYPVEEINDWSPDQVLLKS